MAYCKRFKAIILSSADEAGKKLLARNRCKMWDCEYCADINRAAWRKRIFDYIANNPETRWSFHTFTLHASWHKKPLYFQAQQIKKRWQKLQEWLSRKYGKFEYVRVIERHKDKQFADKRGILVHRKGALHIHVLASFAIPSDDLHVTKRGSGSGKTRGNQYIKLLKKGCEASQGKPAIKNIVQLGFGYKLDNRNIERQEAVTTREGKIVDIGAASVANYVTKYMTKFKADDLREVLDTKIRIISASRGIAKPPKNEALTWRILPHGMSEDFFAIETLLGYEVWDVNTRQKITYDDYEVFEYYPNNLYEDER